MSILAFQQYDRDAYYPYDQSHWTDLIAPVIGLLVAIPLLIWLFRFINRALSQGKACLEHSTTAIDVARESIQVSQEAIDVAREAIALQRETNRLLTALNETMKTRAST